MLGAEPFAMKPTVADWLALSPPFQASLVIVVEPPLADALPPQALLIVAPPRLKFSVHEVIAELAVTTICPWKPEPQLPVVLYTAEQAPVTGELVVGVGSGVVVVGVGSGVVVVGVGSGVVVVGVGSGVVVVGVGVGSGVTPPTVPPVNDCVGVKLLTSPTMIPRPFVPM